MAKCIGGQMSQNLNILVVRGKYIWEESQEKDWMMNVWIPIVKHNGEPVRGMEGKRTGDLIHIKEIMYKEK